MGTTAGDGTATWVAYRPDDGRAAPRWPTSTASTPSPMAATVPATSDRGCEGNGGVIWSRPWTSRASTKLTPAASTSMTTCPGSGWRSTPRRRGGRRAEPKGGPTRRTATTLGRPSRSSGDASTAWRRRRQLRRPPPSGPPVPARSVRRDGRRDDDSGPARWSPRRPSCQHRARVSPAPARRRSGSSRRWRQPADEHAEGKKPTRNVSSKAARSRPAGSSAWSAPRCAPCPSGRSPPRWSAQRASPPIPNVTAARPMLPTPELVLQPRAERDEHRLRRRHQPEHGDDRRQPEPAARWCSDGDVLTVRCSSRAGTAAPPVTTTPAAPSDERPAPRRQRREHAERADPDEQSERPRRLDDPDHPPRRSYGTWSAVHADQADVEDDLGDGQHEQTDGEADDAGARPGDHGAGGHAGRPNGHGDTTGNPIDEPAEQ